MVVICDAYKYKSMSKSFQFYRPVVWFERSECTLKLLWKSSWVNIHPYNHDKITYSKWFWVSSWYNYLQELISSMKIHIVTKWTTVRTNTRKNSTTTQRHRGNCCCCFSETNHNFDSADLKSLYGMFPKRNLHNRIAATMVSYPEVHYFCNTVTFNS